MFVKSMYKFQSHLSSAQAIPLVGPVLVSPCKAVVSLAQIIAGFAGGVICGAFTVITFGNNWFAGRMFNSIGHVGMGFIALGYSVVNILTLGIAAFQIEGFREIPLVRAAKNAALA